MRLALVANDEDVQKIIVRYINTSLELDTTWEIKLFNCIEDARDWTSS